MAKIIIKRVSEFQNRLGKVKVYANQKLIGVITDGETKVFEVKAGTYTLKLKTKWLGSNTTTITLKENDNYAFKLSGLKQGKMLISTALILSILFAFFNDRINVFAKGFFLLIMIIIVSYFIYYFTFGRNKYLKLEEIKIPIKPL
ncbi:amino acid permease [Mesonia hippocampi]|uniref:Amino acid permease n=1 Tax=Mesonia hippocampi TaxID=1628250 RepID=A0A840ETD5_9FLAO|nr:hypothetical protein [Mesonia hippocampi]MBB4119793.1 amino acid permease [Mesonia hippocampi]